MAIELGRRLSPDRMPKNIHFIAVEVNDVWTVTDVMTDEVEKAVPAAVQAVLKVLGLEVH